MGSGCPWIRREEGNFRGYAWHIDSILNAYLRLVQHAIRNCQTTHRLAQIQHEKLTHATLAPSHPSKLMLYGVDLHGNDARVQVELILSILIARC